MTIRSPIRSTLRGAERPTLRAPRLGPNLAPGGGTFDNSTGWTPGTNWAIAGGMLSAANVGAFTTAAGGASIPPGWYQITYTLPTFSAGTVRLQLFGAQSQTLTYRSAVGTYTEIVQITEGKAASNFQAGAAGFTGSIDNLLIQRLIGR